jgi:hypothetical protein
MFSWKPGGGRAREAVHVVWITPPNSPDRDDDKAFHQQVECLEDVSTKYTRVRKTIFVATDVHLRFIDSKAVACAMFKH